ncbi:hypothetical protein FIU89_09455 [Roseovarius sp. THAF27]|uniref:hypothetical protein n=1 Tax=Roseovarius sp. THAF27 TaxID=2587850 RepID=UPI0012692942|nr:hypothetical protein [Roseovarius sp. THAF27]QFT80833.1 hypothetical protein FIU89_09455 [Roseovarius sp. THAF27]
MSYPEIDHTEIALEAGVSAERAEAVLAASWKLAEAFTGQVYDDATPGAHVLEAVRCLALYQLIHSPARREFRVIQAGDSILTRQALGPLFQQSGAGILLAGDVIWGVGTDVALQDEN